MSVEPYLVGSVVRYTSEPVEGYCFNSPRAGTVGTIQRHRKESHAGLPYYYVRFEGDTYVAPAGHGELTLLDELEAALYALGH